MELLHTAHVPVGAGPFPTIIALHGWGASAHDLLGLAPLLHGGEALVLCPQGPVEVPVGPGIVGHGWFPLVPGQPPDPEEFLKGARALRAFFAAARETYPVDPEKVVLLGFSQGGAMAYEWALSEPESVAGLVALATWLPDTLADAVGTKPEQAGLPVLVLHGTQDTMVSIDMARASRERLRDFGVNLMYRELEMAHEISREALQIIVRWLDEKAFG
jgi:phospholipase/carboxylesterase